MNTDKLDIYKVDNDYIEYINNFDEHIAYSKRGNRPYIGIVLTVNDILYFAPMFSPKIKHTTYKDNLSIFKMYGDKEKTDYLGLIRFSDMIPVPEKYVEILDLTTVDKQYKRLLKKQSEYINKIDNNKMIRERASKLYYMVVKSRNNKSATFYRKISCNFKMLEEKCLEYKKEA